MELSIISEEHFLRFFLFGALGTSCFLHSNVVKTHIYSPSWVWETVWETAGAGPCLALLNVFTGKMAILWYGTKPTLPTLATFFPLSWSDHVTRIFNQPRWRLYLQKKEPQKNMLPLLQETIFHSRESVSYSTLSFELNFVVWLPIVSSFA